jgi:hypothetical protein
MAALSPLVKAEQIHHEISTPESKSSNSTLYTSYYETTNGTTPENSSPSPLSSTKNAVKPSCKLSKAYKKNSKKRKTERKKRGGTRKSN